MGRALWSSAHSQFSQAVGGHLLTEAAQRAHLWWLPSKLLEGMLQIGVDTLVNGHAERARRLAALFDAVRVVRWDLVDPSPCRRPRANLVRALIFETGDFVPWDSEAWELDVVDRLRVPTDTFGMPVGGAASRGMRLVGDLTPYRESGQGHATRPAHFRGVRDYDARRNRYVGGDVVRPVPGAPALPVDASVSEKVSWDQILD